MKEHTKSLTWRSLKEIAAEDGIRENAGPRILRHWKFDLISFWSKNHHIYFCFAHQLLTDTIGGVSPMLAHELTWERIVNVVGGPGKTS